MDSVILSDLLAGVPHQTAGVRGPLKVEGVCTDTRMLKPGDLFFALRGEKSDGHNYVRRALDGGAVAAVVSNAPSGEQGDPLVIVNDTLRALGLVARNYRRRFTIPVVAITGSVGKTSVKELTAAVLRTKLKTLASEKNYNNEIGVPLTLFRLSSEHEAAVLELGMRGRGEIDWLAEIAEPTIAVITNIGHSHIERLGSRDSIAEAKSELLARLRSGGLAILPRHDDYFDYMKGRVPTGCRIVTYSDSRQLRPDILVTADPDRGFYSVAVGVGPGDSGAQNAQAVDVQMPGPVAPHKARNAAAALAVALELGISIEAARQGLLCSDAMEGRWRTLHGANGCTIVDDCYNAAPESMEAALGMLAQLDRSMSTGGLPGASDRNAPTDGPTDAGDHAAAGSAAGRSDAVHGRRIAVLGDMRELGEYAPDLHKAIGSQVVQCGVELLVTVGDLALLIAEEAERAARQTGARAPMHRHYSDSRAAAQEIDSLVAPRDTVLVKGSRAMEMEQIVAALSGGEGAGAHG